MILTYCFFQPSTPYANDVVTSQPQPPPDSLPPATEPTPYDPTEEQDLGDPVANTEINRY